MLIEVLYNNIAWPLNEPNLQYSYTNSLVIIFANLVILIKWNKFQIELKKMFKIKLLTTALI